MSACSDPPGQMTALLYGDREDLKAEFMAWSSGCVTLKSEEQTQEGRERLEGRILILVFNLLLSKCTYLKVISAEEILKPYE